MVCIMVDQSFASAVQYLSICCFKSAIFIINKAFFFNGTATTEIYTLSLHDALPIYFFELCIDERDRVWVVLHLGQPDRKSTRLNSSHMSISYAVFCLKKKRNL